MLIKLKKKKKKTAREKRIKRKNMTIFWMRNKMKIYLITTDIILLIKLSSTKVNQRIKMENLRQISIMGV